MKDEKKSRIKITNEMSSQGWALPEDDQSATLLGPGPFKPTMRGRLRNWKKCSVYNSPSDRIVLVLAVGDLLFAGIHDVTDVEKKTLLLLVCLAE